MMMHQKMTPQEINFQMQMHTEQAIYQQQLTNQQLIMQRTSPNVVHMDVANINSMAPINPSHPSMPFRGMDVPRMNVSQGASPIGISDPYCCYFLEQLQGSYVIDGEENEEFQVVLSCKDNQQYGIVQRSLPNVENITKEYIYEEDFRFTLCSQTGGLKAIMMKGVNMKLCLTWYTNGGSQIVWHRKGNVSFNLVQSTPNTSRRSSIASTCSRISSLETSVGSMQALAHGNKRIRPELQQPLSENDSKPIKCSSLASNTSSAEKLISQEEVTLSEENLLSLFQSHLTNNPFLLQRVVNWGISRIPNCRVGEREIYEFGNGRVWVTGSIMQSDPEDGKKWNEVLDELKGAYQEVNPGVYLQTPPQENEPGVQHRLMRNSLGLWIIEEYNVDQDNWVMCAEELPYGYWVDSKDSRKMYRVRIVPMVNILNRMKEELTDVDETERNMDFLFKSCNHKKLNANVKARNLRHNIATLKVKLEKQHMLCFGVMVANMADTIALERQRESCEEISVAN